VRGALVSPKQWLAGGRRGQQLTVFRPTSTFRLLDLTPLLSGPLSHPGLSPWLAQACPRIGYLLL
jgi:hypothetical protein